MTMPEDEASLLQQMGGGGAAAAASPSSASSRPAPQRPLQSHGEADEDSRLHALIQAAQATVEEGVPARERGRRQIAFMRQLSQEALRAPIRARAARLDTDLHAVPSSLRTVMRAVLLRERDDTVAVLQTLQQELLVVHDTPLIPNAARAMLTSEMLQEADTLQHLPTMRAALIVARTPGTPETVHAAQQVFWMRHIARCWEAWEAVAREAPPPRECFALESSKAWFAGVALHCALQAVLFARAATGGRSVEALRPMLDIRNAALAVFLAAPVHVGDVWEAWKRYAAETSEVVERVAHTLIGVHARASTSRRDLAANWRSIMGYKRPSMRHIGSAYVAFMRVLRGPPSAQSDGVADLLRELFSTMWASAARRSSAAAARRLLTGGDDAAGYASRVPVPGTSEGLLQSGTRTSELLRLVQQRVGGEEAAASASPSSVSQRALEEFVYDPHLWIPEVSDWCRDRLSETIEEFPTETLPEAYCTRFLHEEEEGGSAAGAPPVPVPRGPWNRVLRQDTEQDAYYTVMVSVVCTLLRALHAAALRVLESMPPYAALAGEARSRLLAIATAGAMAQYSLPKNVKGVLLPVLQDLDASGVRSAA